MIFCTSISPTHRNGDIQLKCIESWHKTGHKIYSFNSKAEIEILKERYPKYVNFVPVNRTGEYHYGKPYVYVDSIFDWFKESGEELLCLINSDILLAGIPKQIENQWNDSIIISSRTDYVGEPESMKNMKKWNYGFDVFFIHKKFAHIFPKSIYCLGQCWFDYWIPYLCLKNSIPLYRIKENFAFHKLHPAQYNHQNYKTTIDFFKLENRIINNNDQKLSDAIWTHIMTHSKEI